MAFGAPSRERSNQQRAYYSAATDTTDLFYRGREVRDGQPAVLNCSFAHPTLDAFVAGLELGGITIIDGMSEGNIVETANDCRVETTVPTVSGGTKLVSVPCYEWLGNYVGIDILSVEDMPYHTLDMERLRYFGTGVDAEAAECLVDTTGE